LFLPVRMKDAPAGDTMRTRDAEGVDAPPPKADAVVSNAPCTAVGCCCPAPDPSPPPPTPPPPSAALPDAPPAAGRGGVECIPPPPPEAGASGLAKERQCTVTAFGSRDRRVGVPQCNSEGTKAGLHSTAMASRMSKASLALTDARRKSKSCFVRGTPPPPPPLLPVLTTGPALAPAPLLPAPPPPK
jgi:hypothetical protein